MQVLSWLTNYLNFYLDHHQPLPSALSGLISAAMTAFGTAGIKSGELDLPGLIQAINNLDGRTTNNAQDIQALQLATQTTPAPHVDVSVVQTTTATPAPAVQLQAPTEVAAATPAPTPEPTPCVTPSITNSPGTTITVIGGGCQ